jgi:hypothetical protein
MISAGAVGATFDIENLASPKLKALMSEFQALQTQIDKTQEAMRALAVPPGMNRSLGVTETRMTAIANAAKVAGDESTGGVSQSGRVGRHDGRKPWPRCCGYEGRWRGGAGR